LEAGEARALLALLWPQGGPAPPLTEKIETKRGYRRDVEVLTELVERVDDRAWCVIM